MGYSDRDFTAMRQLSESNARKKNSLGIGCSRCNGVFERFGGDSFDNHSCTVNHSLSFFDFIKRLFK